jgi:predicted secreted protein
MKRRSMIMAAALTLVLRVSTLAADIDIPTKVAEATAMAKQGRVKDALDLLDDLAKTSPGDPMLDLGYGMVYGQSGSTFSAKRSAAKLQHFLDSQAGSLSETYRERLTGFIEKLKNNQPLDLEAAAPVAPLAPSLPPQPEIHSPSNALNSDLIAVANPALPDVSGLAPGSAEALQLQTRGAADLNVSIEQRTRYAGIRLRLIPYSGGQMWLGMYEVTQAQWKRVMGNNPATNYFAEQLDYPVEGVSLSDAESFCRALAEKEGVPIGTYNIPREDLWESACRAGTLTMTYAGDVRIGPFSITCPALKTIFRDSTFSDSVVLSYYGRTSRLNRGGQTTPNAFGLYDTIGNLLELCQKSEKDPSGAIRGGCYMWPWATFRADSTATVLSDERHQGVGFRVARKFTAAAASTTHTLQPTPAQQAAETYVVQTGDTLASIAAEMLGWDVTNDGRTKIITKSYTLSGDGQRISNDGQIVVLSGVARVLIQLGGNPSTGYQWRIGRIDGAAVQADGDVRYLGSQSDPKMCGVGGTVEACFRVKAKGKATVTMEYRRPGETSMPDVETFTVTLDVQDVPVVPDAGMAE